VSPDASRLISVEAFELDVATRIQLGHGVVARLPEVAAARMRRPVLVTGVHHAERSGLRARIAELLGDTLGAVVMVPAEPTTDDVDRVARTVRDQHADGLVAVGGGSVIDAAKAAAVLDGRQARQLLGGSPDPAATGPAVVAVPTTGGTGAEVTRGALIVDPDTGAKAAIRGRRVAPAVALVDPDLLAGLPFGTVVDTCFDAFAHGLEGLLARRSTPFSTPFSAAAVRAAADLLHRLDPRRPLTPDEARMLCTAGVCGGLSVASASTCLPHRLQQAMSGSSDSHGRGLLRLYPAWWRRVRAARPGALALVEEVLGRDGVDAAVARARAMVPLRPLTPEVDRWIAAVTGNVDNDPLAPPDPGLLRSLYEEAV
jgi:alcohol dehydrogenase